MSLSSSSIQDTGKFRTNTKDQFYTDVSVAKKCITQITSSLQTIGGAGAGALDPSSYLWIEPSAGAGAFLGIYTGETIALDLEPKAAGVVAQDFLKWTSAVAPSKRVFFGNPPFGRQGSIAKKFLRHACEQGADALAFILPRSFMKPSMYGCIPPNFHLVKQWELPKDSFEVNKEPYDVPCVFQIWEKQGENRTTVDKEDPDGFVYVKPGEAYDLAFRRVGGDAGKTYTRAELEAPSAQSHHFLKFDEGIDVADIQKRVNKHMFPSNTTGPRSLSKSEINAVLNKLIHASLDADLASLELN
jgi:hypothetical protein